MSEAVQDDVQTSVEQDGRILTGVGVSESDLRDVMEAVDGEAAESEQAATAPAQPRASDGKFAKESRGQKRFRELTSARDTEANRAAALEKERDEWKQKYEASQRPASAAPAASVAPVAPAPAAEAAPTDRPKPTEDEIGTKYQSYADFMEDLADWKSEQRLRAAGLPLSAAEFDARLRDRLEAERASREQSERVNQALTRGKAAYADFETVLNAPHMSVDWPAEKIAAIARLEAFEHVQYALGKDPALAERLRTTDAVTFGMELARLMTPVRAVSTASAPRAVLDVPAPFQPVTGVGSTTVRSSTDLAETGDDDYDLSGFREKRAQERKAHRG